MGLYKLCLSGRILQRRGLRTVGSRVLSTSESKANEQWNGNIPAKKWSVIDGDGEGSQSLDGINHCAVLGAYLKEDGTHELSNAAKMEDNESGGKLSKELNTVADRMEKGKAFVVTDVGRFSAVALASYGPKHIKENLPESLYEERVNTVSVKENTRWGVGAGVRALQQRGARVIEVDWGQRYNSAAEAAQLATWQFDEFVSPEGKRPPTVIRSWGTDTDVLWMGGMVYGAAQNWARYLSDMPANKMTPTNLAKAVIEELCLLGVKVVAHDRAWIEAQRMEAFLAVACGSCEEPVFLECEWKNGDGPTVLVAAPGVTFDCGGICLKEHEHMMGNRESMAGAAAALGAMKAVAELKMELNVTMVIPLCENMISGQCMKVGDVVCALNGLNILIEDTDVAGRLMLADALVYGQAAHQPEIVIDIAALTHGILRATGGGVFGAFTNDELLWKCLHDAGGLSGTRPWRFPLWDYYHRQIVNNPSVDLRSRGSGKASPCLGAAFLKNFVCGKWIHMDTTGLAKPGHAAPPYLTPGRMTGRPADTLMYLFANLARRHWLRVFRQKEKKEKEEREKKEKEENEKKEKEENKEKDKQK